MGRLARIWAAVLLGLLPWAAGCTGGTDDSMMPGPVPPALYADAQIENQQRLAGEDAYVRTFLQNPWDWTVYQVRVSVMPGTLSLERLYGKDERKGPYRKIYLGTPTYIVREGDTLFRIARDIVGDSSAVSKLLEINHDVLKGPKHDTVYAGMELYLPPKPDLIREGITEMSDTTYGRRAPDILKLYADFAGSKSPAPYNETNDDTVRVAALRALNRARAPGQTDLFMDALTIKMVAHPMENGEEYTDIEPTAAVRLEAAEALSNIPNPKAIAVLATASRQDQDPDQDVRIACVDALRNYDDPAAYKALLDALQDSDFGVAWQARQSLELLTGQDFRYDRDAWQTYLTNVRKI